MAPTDESLFAEYCRTRDPRGLGEVFDRTAAELLHVATYLCAGDRSLVEDALQATYLTAITDAETFDPERRLRPWLLGILANQVRRERRERRRVAGVGDGPFAMLARPEPRLDEAAAGELRAVLAGSLGRLPSPYREVLVLHLDHGLDSTEIGRALDRQPSTVRTQLARGLVQLRAILPAGLTAGVVLALSQELLAQTRAVVLGRAVVLARAAAGPASAAAMSLASPQSGGRKLLMSLGLGCLSAALGAAWFVLGSTAEPLPAPAAPAVSGVATGLMVPAAAATGAARSLVAGPGSDPGGATPDDSITIAVVRKDPPGPVVGAMVALGLHLPGYPRAPELPEVRYATTDARGHVTFAAVPAVDDVSVNVVGTDFADTLSRADGQPLRLVVDGGTDLAVRVVDGTGQPVPDATVMTNGGSHLVRPWRLLGRTDATGMLRVAHQAAHTQLVAWASGRAPSAMADLTLYPGVDQNHCTLRLDRPGLELRGRVVDERGRPVAGAVVAMLAMATWPPIPAWFRSDAQGRFTADWVPSGHVALTAQHVVEGQPRSDRQPRSALLRTDFTAAAELELRLTPGGSVTGRTGMLKTPGGGVTTATVLARFLPDAIHELPLLSIFTSADGGSYRLAGLTPGRWELTAQFGATRIARVVTVREGETQEWDPAVPEIVTMRVAVRDAQGRPLPGWRVSPLNAYGFESGSIQVTDAAGEAGAAMGWEFPVDQPVGLALHAPLAADGTWEAFPTLTLPPQPVRRDVLPVTVPDRLRPTRFIAGTLRAVSPAALPGWQVVARSARAPGIELAGERIGERAFRIGPLSEGRYQAAIELQGMPTFELGELRVAADRDLDLGEITVGAFGTVQVRLTEGSASAGLSLLLVSEHGETCELERQGDLVFRARRVPHGRYTLRGHAPAAHVAARPVVVDRERIELEAAAVRCPTLQLTVVLPEDGDRSQTGWSGAITVRDAGDLVVLRTDVSHTFWGRWQSRLGFPFGLPPGRYHVEVCSWDKRLVVGECTVTDKGGALEFPLR